MASTSRPLLAACCIGATWRTSVLDARARALIGEYAEVVDVDPESLELRSDLSSDDRSLSEARVLITGWGSPRLDSAVLDRFPDLELVVHAAGSVRGIVTDEQWRRGIRLSTAAAANAVSVADFTMAQIQLSLKNAWRLAADSRARRSAAPRRGVRGLDGATVGLVGFGSIGRLVAERLAPLDLHVVVHDPFVDADELTRAGVRSVSLPELFSRSDVVSLHAPLTESTAGMIGRDLLASLPDGATLINTARGGVVDGAALVDVFTGRPDVTALLDVTDPEPLPAGHPLFFLDNVFITPHVAGSLGSEEARLGLAAAREIVRYVRGEPLAHEVEEGRLALSA